MTIQYCVELVIAFIVIFLLLYIALMIRRSFLKFNDYYKHKIEKLDEIDKERAKFQDTLNDFGTARKDRTVVMCTTKQECMQEILDSIDRDKPESDTERSGLSSLLKVFDIPQNVEDICIKSMIASSVISKAEKINNRGTSGGGESGGEVK